MKYQLCAFLMISSLAVGASAAPRSTCPSYSQFKNSYKTPKLSKEHAAALRAAELQIGSVVRLVTSEEVIIGNIDKVFPELFGHDLFYPELYASRETRNHLSILSQVWAQTSIADRREMRELAGRWVLRLYGVFLHAAREQIEHSINGKLNTLKFGESVQNFLNSVGMDNVQVSPLVEKFVGKGFNSECLSKMINDIKVVGSPFVKPQTTDLISGDKQYLVTLTVHPDLVLMPGLLPVADAKEASLQAIVRRDSRTGKMYVIDIRAPGVGASLRNSALQTWGENAASEFYRYRREGIKDADMVQKLVQEIKKLGV